MNIDLNYNINITSQTLTDTYRSIISSIGKSYYRRISKQCVKVLTQIRKVTIAMLNRVRWDSWKKYRILPQLYLEVKFNFRNISPNKFFDPRPFRKTCPNFFPLWVFGNPLYFRPDLKVHFYLSKRPRIKKLI